MHNDRNAIDMTISWTGVATVVDQRGTAVTFVKNADLCEHLAGEWDSDLEPARKRAIERGVDKYCDAAQRQLGIVEARYRQDRALSALIAQHGYDAVRSCSK